MFISNSKRPFRSILCPRTLLITAKGAQRVFWQYVFTMNEGHVPQIQEKLPSHKVIYIGRDAGFKLSGIPLGGEQYIRTVLQNNLDKTKHIIANISRLTNVQEKLILLLQCIPGRIQHLLAAVPPHLSRVF